MKLLKSLPVFCVFGLTFSGFASGCADKKVSAPVSGAIAVTPTGTTNYTSKESKFSIYLPTKPTESHKNQQAMAQTYEVAQFQSEAAPITYIVLAIKIPKTADVSNTGAFLDGVQSGFLQSASAKLESRRDLSLAGAPGLEMSCSLNNGAALGRVRVYVVPPLSYQIMAVGLKKDFNGQNKQIDKVLNSFRIDQ